MLHCLINDIETCVNLMTIDAIEERKRILNEYNLIMHLMPYNGALLFSNFE